MSTTTPIRPAPELAAHRPGGSRASRLLADQQMILAYVLIAMVILFTIINPVFFSVGVFGNILVDWAPIALISVGELFVVVSGGIDLSVGSTITISGVVSALVMAGVTGGGWPDPLSILAGTLVSLAVGLLVGLVNAALINIAKLVPFIATLATLGAGAGVALVITKGGPIGGGPPSAIGLSTPQFGPFSWPIIAVIVIVAIAGLFLHRARFGRYTFAVGGNAFATTAAGVSVPRHLTKVYALSGLMAGAAGMVTYMTLGSGSPTAGTSDELNAIAAVVIGGASLMGGVGKIGGTVLGSLILTTVTSGLILVDINPNWNQIVVAVLIAAAVSLHTLRRRIGHRRQS